MTHICNSFVSDAKPNQSRPMSPSVEKRKFQESWKVGRTWLKFDSVKQVMFCTICRSAQVCNSFTVGCSKMKKENVVNHEQFKGMCDNLNCFIFQQFYID